MPILRERTGSVKETVRKDRIHKVKTMDSNELRKSSIVVAVRVRPFTEEENAHLICDGDAERIYPKIGDTNLMLPTKERLDVENEEKTRPPAMTRPRGIRKVVECVDDKMLIFDPADTNPLNKMSETVLNSMYSRKRASRRRLRRNGGEIKFVFDKLFDQNATQEQVYASTTSSLLDSVLDGFNGTVFAYGATGCGKTYTVSGSPDQPGIVFQAMQELFCKIEDLSDTKSFEISLSYLEIYNESIRDLLSPGTSTKKLVIREDSENRISVANLSQHRPTTVQDVMDLVIKGNMSRTTSATDANETSSRSHAVLQIHILQTNRSLDLTSDHTFSTLSIIDLAGSERAAATKNRGERLYEGANINRSLLALGNCINALCISDGTRRTCHVPYRDSKLTRLLKFSLGGNCKTVMIVCVSPSSTHYDETLNTLKYANRAKEIKTKVIRNHQSLDRHVGSYLKMIAEQKREIDELRQRERAIIELNFKRYKLSQQKIQMAIEDCMNGVKTTFDKLENYQNAKLVKSLVLCKRRFLQLVKLEINNVISIVQNWTALDVLHSCTMLNEQLTSKIHELEEKFDTTDELELVIEHAKTVSLNKLREMENWDESRDLSYFQSKLDHISETVRNEVLINASMMVEKLLEDATLSKRFQFLSSCLFNEHDIQLAVQDLVKIDEEFEDFGKSFLINNAYNKHKSVSKNDIESPSSSSLAATATSAASITKTVRRVNPETSFNDSGTPNMKPQLPDPMDVDVSMQDILPPAMSTTTSTSKGRTPSNRNSLLNHQLLSHTT